MLFAAMFGMFGFSLGWMVIISHLSSLKSAGIPYMAPIMPTIYADLKDTFIRAFPWKMKKRPRSIPHLDDNRQKP